MVGMEIGAPNGTLLAWGIILRSSMHGIIRIWIPQGKVGLGHEDLNSGVCNMPALLHVSSADVPTKTMMPERSVKRWLRITQF